MQTFVDRLKTIPVLGSLVKFADARPRLAAWIVLSLGIIILLLIEARDVGLLIGQWIALIVASILVAGACIWIVSWEDTVESEQDVANKTPVAPIVSTPADEPKPEAN